MAKGSDSARKGARQQQGHGHEPCKMVAVDVGSFQPRFAIGHLEPQHVKRPGVCLVQRINRLNTPHDNEHSSKQANPFLSAQHLNHAKEKQPVNDPPHQRHAHGMIVNRQGHPTSPASMACHHLACGHGLRGHHRRLRRQKPHNGIGKRHHLKTEKHRHHQENQIKGVAWNLDPIPPVLSSLPHTFQETENSP